MAPQKQVNNSKKGKTLKKTLKNVHQETKAVHFVKSLLMHAYNQNLWSQFSNCCNWIRQKCQFLSGIENTDNTSNPTLTIEYCLTCSVCLGSFKDPVIIRCGDTFCRSCITAYWKGSDTNVCCPLCKMDFPDRHLIPNRNLEYILEDYCELFPSDNAKDHKIIGNLLKRYKTKAIWFSAIQKLKSISVHDILKRCRETVQMVSVNLYRSVATVYSGGPSIVAAENACAKNGEETQLPA